MWLAMGNNRDKQRHLGVFRGDPSNRAKAIEHQRVSCVQQRIAIELNIIVENVEECVQNRDIKRATQVIVRIIALNLAPSSSVVVREAVIQGVCADQIVKYVIPNTIKSSKDVITKGDFLSGLVQSLSEVKLPNTVEKFASKHAISTTLINSSSNTSIWPKARMLKVHPKNVAMVFHINN